MNDQHLFDVLLNLMNIMTVDRNMIWEIVNSLPLNRYVLCAFSRRWISLLLPVDLSTLEVSLRTLDGVDVSKILDPQSIFKLLYSLRIVDSLMLPKNPEATPEELQEAKVLPYVFLVFHCWSS